MTVSDTLSSRPAGILRRFGAMVYDGFVVAAVLFIAALPLPVLDQLASGEAWALTVKRVYLLGACFAYLGGFWVHGGQTVGMKAWRLHLVTGRWPSTALERCLLALYSILPVVGSTRTGFFLGIRRSSSTHLARSSVSHAYCQS